MKFVNIAFLVTIFLVVAGMKRSTRIPRREDCFSSRNVAGKNACMGSVQRWHYDNNHSTCLPFIHSGCSVPKNLFRTCESCMKTCLRRSNPQAECKILSEISDS
uniref:Putative bpti/kunitz family of serine protease inhibitor n=1 Tax=Amblyomma americanum TaxID=6943 RepID=A0A0C9SCW5_AMBAM